MMDQILKNLENTFSDKLTTRQFYEKNKTVRKKEVLLYRQDIPSQYEDEEDFIEISVIDNMFVVAIYVDNDMITSKLFMDVHEAVNTFQERFMYCVEMFRRAEEKYANVSIG